AWLVAAALRSASFSAAAIRSSTTSLSAPSAAGSMVTRFTSWRQVITTLTMPAPAWPSTSICASCSCILRMLSCICCACFISPASWPFIMSAFLATLFRFDRIFLERAVEILDQLTHERIFADLRHRRRLALLRLAVGDGLGRHAGHLAGTKNHLQLRAQYLAQRGTQLVAVRLVEQALVCR